MSVARWWFLGRLFTIVAVMTFEPSPVRELDYYQSSMLTLDRATMPEYPLPSLLVMLLPWLVTRVTGLTYEVTFPGFILVVDALFTWFLARRQGPSRDGALRLWLLGIPLLGPTTYFRFDLVPGVLVAMAFLVLVTRPRVAALLVTVAAAVKLWPLILFPQMVAASKTWLRRALALTALFAASCLAVVLVAGWPRLFSPLHYQADRGLQIESTLAGPAMLGWSLDPHTWQVAKAPSKSFEITGPWTSELNTLSGTLMLVGAGMLALCWLYLVKQILDRRPVGPAAVAWLTLAGVGMYLTVSRVFSPQYLLWLLPLTAAAVHLVGDTKTLRTWSTVLLVVCGSTHLIFPLGYNLLVSPYGAFSVLAVVNLISRNVLLVWLTVTAARHAMTCLRAEEPAAVPGAVAPIAT